MQSRFFKSSDENTNFFYYALPDSWWSRKYEYVWASHFVNENDIILDAACGVSHPFKLWCVDKAKEVWASEIDDRIFLFNDFRIEFENDIKIACDEKIKSDYLKIRFNRSDLTEMNLDSNLFNKTFCISVLEHIDKYLNISNYKQSNLYKSISELKRVTKKDGLLIFTFDYPHIDIPIFKQIVDDLELKFVEEIDSSITSDSLYYPDKKLYCFRSVLQKI